jgi:imidazolonepropionase-like amidohydrolase
VDPTLGRIATGAVADLVFVDGDPLSDIDEALNVVAVLRNGRFFSVAGLIDRVKAAEIVE